MKKSVIIGILTTLMLLITGVAAVNSVSASTNSINTKEFLTGDKLQSTKVKVYIDPNVSSGIKQDIQWGVKDWQQSTNKIAFSYTNNPNNATIRFTTGTFDNLINAMTYDNQTIPNGKNKLIVNAIIKINRDLIDTDKLTNFGIRIVEHEIGHVLGLADIKDSGLKYSTVMWWKDPNTGITALDDRAINSIY
ncbi:hypothetical protein [Companilactobacillus ginsenosidimutans]|uniref:Peptidase M10 metallopeptidase domain-containing protein n=1 Tax=Companilactobacillus ginsenosidimutans TaxID=1007676 RepID=A0A0H4QLP9_9LACO|nr:hypothetical protein [Companilactobacillus ginsenosidimutans]AKP67618.1 hypothetical protein ABM34_08795 [Companilactobacillus ginsenosidimutans]